MAQQDQQMVGASEIPLETSVEVSSLHSVAANGTLDDVKRLLTTDAKLIHSRDDKQRTPLHCAAEKGCFRVVEYLLTRGAHVDSKDKDECTALHYAANLDVVNCLVEKKANVNSKDCDKRTPLHYAAMRGRDVVDHVVTKGAYIHYQDKDGKTPLHYAARKGLRKVVDYLVKKGAQVNSKDKEDKTPLHYAAENGNLNVVTLLLEREAQVDGRVDSVWSSWFSTSSPRRFVTTNVKTPLHYAAMEGHCEVVAYLMKKGAQVDSKDQDDKTPLHYAAMHGHLSVVEHLVEHLVEQGASAISKKEYVNSKDRRREKTPLHYAVSNGHHDVVKYLIEQEADVNSKDKFDVTPLHCAAEYGHCSIVEQLINKGAQIDSRDNHHCTALHHAVMLDSNLEVVQCLVEKGADVNSEDAAEPTPLHKAAMKGNLEIVKYLVDHGANVNNSDHKGFTSVYKAIRDGHDKVSQYLLQHGAEQADVICAMIDDLEATICQCSSDHFQHFKDKMKSFEKQGIETAGLFQTYKTSLLHCAVAAGSKEMVEELVKLGADTDHHESNFEWKKVKYEQIAPLHLAAERGHDDIVELLLKNGATAETEDAKKNTPLHAAASKGHQKIVELLVKHGADVQRKFGFKKRTPLHFASYNGKTETVDFLLKREADPTAVDFNGRNCLHLAIRANHKETVLHLLEDERWKEMLKKCDDYLETPLKNLIDQMPDVAEMCLSKCVETNEGELTSFMDKVRPTSETYHVSFDYEVLQQEINPDSLRFQGKSFKTTHPLYYISESGNTRLLFHPLVTSLLKHKWDSFGNKLFFANLLLYTVFLFNLTGFGMSALSPLEQTDDCGGTLQYSLFAASTILLAVIRLVLEIVQLVLHGPRAYLSDPVNYIEIPLYASSIIFTSVFTTPCLHVHHWQWQFGVLAVFLGWIVLITFLQKWPPTGIYVIAFLTTMKSFLKVALLAVFLVIAFALPFYMQFFEPGKTRHAFIHPARAVVKVMSMTTGELDYDDIFHQQEGEEEIAFPMVSFPFWILFLVMMPVLLNNYLTGLAVGDIKEMLEQCEVSRARLQIDLVLSLEGMLKKFDCRHLFCDIPMQNGISINKPNSVSDGHYTTGREIAEALKPQAKPIEEHLKLQSEELKQQLEKQGQQLGKQGQQLEEKLKQQTMAQGKQLEEQLKEQTKEQGQQLEAKLKQQNQEQGQQLEANLKQQSHEQGQQLEAKLKQQNQEQGQQLEAKLKQQNQEQGQQLEANLKQQSHEQGQQLEANLKQQNQEQVQMLEEKLKLQSEEHSKQLSKQSAEHSEQLQQLEGRLQEQIKQLASDVASMKELLMKLASK